MERIMLVIALILFLITFFVLVLAFSSRWRLKKRESYKTRKSDQLVEVIIRFVSGEISKDKVEAELENRLDFIILLEMVNELDHALDGPEEKRLQQLMNLKTIRQHFDQRFASGEALLQAKACLYYAKKADLTPDKLPKLADLSSSNDPILSYAASSALMVHGNMKDKSVAIKNILRNKQISPMALSDILVQFTRHGTDYHEEEALLLMKFVEDDQLPPDRVATLIRVLNELEYLQSTDFLWDFYHQSDHEATHPELIEVLLDILTKFGREEVLKDIHTHFTISKHANIRNAAARSMGFFKDDSSIPFLKWLLNDPDFMVRFEAARSISKFDNVDLKKIKPPNLTQKEWSDLAGEVLYESRL